MKNKPWFVYIIQNVKGFLYTGITTDVTRRFKEHSTGKKGAKFFHSGKPVKIIYQKKFANRSLASKFEAHIKSLSRSEKLELVKS
jgi:putative endonuclease